MSNSYNDLMIFALVFERKEGSRASRYGGRMSSPTRLCFSAIIGSAATGICNGGIYSPIA